MDKLLECALNGILQEVSDLRDRVESIESGNCSTCKCKGAPETPLPVEEAPYVPCTVESRSEDSEKGTPEEDLPDESLELLYQRVGKLTIDKGAVCPGDIDGLEMIGSCSYDCVTDSFSFDCVSCWRAALEK